MADGAGGLSGLEGVRRAYGSFRGWCWSRHVAAIALLVAIIVLRFSNYLFTDGVLLDERVFVGAFEKVVAGSSPYLAEPFNYPAPFALLGAILLEAWGLFPVLLFLRGLCALGLAITVWWAAAFLPGPFCARVATAGIFVVLAPPVAFAIRIGNLQFLVTGLLLSAIFLWPRRPVIAAFMLAASCLVKPIGVFAGVVLFFHRPSEPTRRHQVVAVLAGAMVLSAVVLSPHWLEFWQVAREPDRVALTLSVHRIFHSFGIRIDPRVVALAVLALSGVWARWRPRVDWALMPVAVVASLAATPVLWSHSLVLALPMQAMALTAAWTRRRQARASTPTWELPLVGLAVVGLQFSEASTRMGELDPLLQLVLALPVIVTPFALAFYLDGLPSAGDQPAGGSVMTTAE